MNDGLMSYSTGSSPVPMRDRKVSRQAKEVFDEVRLAGLKTQGVTALAGKIMEEMVELDEYRRTLAQGDIAMSALLMEIEASAIRQAKRIQNGLFDPLGGS